MFMVYTAMDRTLIFATDPLYTKQMNNQKESYKYRRWKEFGYLDYVPYSDYLLELQRNGEIIDKEIIKAYIISFIFCILYVIYYISLYEHFIK